MSLQGDIVDTNKDLIFYVAENFEEDEQFVLAYNRD